LKLPEYPDNLADEIRVAFEQGKGIIVVVRSALGREEIISMKEDDN
jgi:hypothetical protein